MGFDEEFGEGVRHLREVAGRTQEQVAESMGVAVSTVSRLERGVSGINTSRLPALARALGVTVTDLFQPQGDLPAIVSDMPPSLST